MLCENQYALPTIEFVGGETQSLQFHTYIYSNGSPFDLQDTTRDFSVIHFSDKTGEPILSKSMDIAVDPASGVYNTLRVKLSAAETVNLSGKYIYQITIKDASGNTEIPKQGIMYITNNIHKGFIA